MSSSEDRCHATKLMFNLQSGSPAFLKKEDVSNVFSKFGQIQFLYFKAGFTFGWVKFKTAKASTLACNLRLSITNSTGQWELHTFKDFISPDLTEEAFRHQILLESRDLPTSWENIIIVKEFFKKFGEVTSLIHLGFDSRRIQRIAVSFQDSRVAQELVGTTQKILNISTKVKAVSLEGVRKGGFKMSR